MAKDVALLASTLQCCGALRHCALLGKAVVL